MSNNRENPFGRGKLPEDPQSTNSSPIDEFLSADSASDDEEDKILKSTRRKESFKRISLISVIGLVAVGAVFSFIRFNPFTGGEQNFTQSEQSSNTVPIQSGQSGTSQSGTTEPNFNEEGKVLPIKYEDWQIFNYSNDETTAEEASKYYENAEFHSQSSILPQESAGFTSDITKQELDDGSLNPMFSFWTQERFNRDTSVILQRFLNPSFGAWENYQFSDGDAANNFDPSIFGDIFTQQWKDANASNPASTWIPILADWNSNDYGMNNLPTHENAQARWIGEINSSNTEWTYDDSTNQYTVVLNADIQYVSWTSNGDKLEKTGKMTLKLVANTDVTDNDTSRVLVDESHLEVN